MNHLEPVVTAYSVSILPEDHPDHHDFAIRVERTHHSGKWAVRWRSLCLNAAGDWDWEPRPSGRDNEWLTEHRFDLAQALAEATIVASGLTVNGITAEQALRTTEASPPGGEGR